MSLLERRRLIETHWNDSNERVCRLTAQGRLHALGGRDPERYWARDWDGRWRMVLFDVPVACSSYRRRLRRYLRVRGFGCLQGSVWVTPDPLEEESKILVGAKIDVGSLLLLDAQPCAGESDAEIVATAWDFERINRRYARLMQILDERPDGPLRSESSMNAMLRWVAAEHEAWLEAVASDPLLPKRILPPGYLGQTAWLRRLDVLSKAGAELQKDAHHRNEFLSQGGQKIE
jgi:phenylacetic acid degradation operon negative regulatory protein